MQAHDTLVKAAILSAAQRLAFSGKDRAVLAGFLDHNARTLGPGLCIAPHRDREETAADGVMFLKPASDSPAMVMLVNFNFGTDFLGRPKRMVYSFYSPIGKDDWTLLGAFDRLKEALDLLAGLFQRRRETPKANFLAMLNRHVLSR